MIRIILNTGKRIFNSYVGSDNFVSMKKYNARKEYKIKHTQNSINSIIKTAQIDDLFEENVQKTSKIEQKQA